MDGGDAEEVEGWMIGGEKNCKCILGFVSC